MSPAEIKIIDELHDKLAMRIAAMISDQLRDRFSDNVCNLVFDKLADALVEEGDSVLIGMLDEVVFYRKDYISKKESNCG